MSPNPSKTKKERFGPIKSPKDELYGWPSTTLLRPLLGLFHGEKGGKRFRDRLCNELRDQKILIADAVERALEEIPLFVLNRAHLDSDSSW